MRANTPHYGTRDYHFIHYIAKLKKKNYFDVRIEAFFKIMSLII